MIFLKPLRSVSINVFAVVLTVIMTSFPAVANEVDTPTPKSVTDEAASLVDKLDSLYRADTSESTMTMIVQTPDFRRTMSLTIWSEGMEKTLVRIDAPKKDKGVSSLKVGREMWNYMPKIERVMKVPPSMMMGSWMGSDFTNDDVVREDSYKKDFQASVIHHQDYKTLVLTPKSSAVTVWGKIEIDIDDQNLPVKQRYFDDNNHVQRRLVFSDVKLLGGRLLPTKMEMQPISKQGHKTIMIYKTMMFNKPLPSNTFTQRNLRKVGR